MPLDLSEEHLASTEAKIGARFPDSFRSRMKKSNGGVVIALDDEWDLIPFQDTATKKRLSRTANHILVELAQFREWVGWPENAYAIGANGCGDALVLVRIGDKFDGRVFVWRHETGKVILAEKEFSFVSDA